MAEVHNLGHPSIHSTRWLVAEHFVWRGLHADIAKWARECIAYQRNKVQQACSRSHPAIYAGLSTCACWHCRPFATVRYLLTRWSVYTVAGSCASRDNHCRRLYHCFPFSLGIAFRCAWLRHLWSWCAVCLGALATTVWHVRHHSTANDGPQLATAPSHVTQFRDAVILYTL